MSTEIQRLLLYGHAWRHVLKRKNYSTYSSAGRISALRRHRHRLYMVDHTGLTFNMEYFFLSHFHQIPTPPSHNSVTVFLWQKILLPSELCAST